MVEAIFMGNCEKLHELATSLLLDHIDGIFILHAARFRRIIVTQPPAIKHKFDASRSHTNAIQISIEHLPHQRRLFDFKENFAEIKKSLEFDIDTDLRR